MGDGGCWFRGGNGVGGNGVKFWWDFIDLLMGLKWDVRDEDIGELKVFWKFYYEKLLRWYCN